ncbi:MAG: DinB family protein [Acidobacteriota bacterium]
MDSIDLIRENLEKSSAAVLQRIEDMRDHCIVFPTPNGGAHTLWVLGHLTYIEGLVIQTFMLGKANPFAHWEEPFDGADVSGDPDHFPPFDDALAACRSIRNETLTLLGGLREQDLDRLGAKVPEGHEGTFGTYRRCFQFVADHGYMHRGQLADARRAAGLERMGF